MHELINRSSPNAHKTFKKDAMTFLICVLADERAEVKQKSQQTVSKAMGHHIRFLFLFLDFQLHWNGVDETQHSPQHQANQINN